MAKERWLNEVEKGVIRLGHANGATAAEIARVLGRAPNTVATFIRKDRDAGTLDQVPLPFQWRQLAGEAGEAGPDEV